MLPALEEVAQELDKEPETLWRESLRAYISRELRLIHMDIIDLQDRYDVAEPDQLQARIESGEVYSHPAWEELIEWENLVRYQERLTRLQRSLD